MKNRQPKTIEEYCWLFLIADVERLYTAGNILYEDYLVLRMCKKNNKFPPDELVRECFKDIFRFLNKNNMNTWRRVKKFWLEEHKEFYWNTPVYKAKIRNLCHSKSDPLKVKVYSDTKLKGGGRVAVVTNIHQYDLSDAKSVYIHGDIITTIAK